MGKPKSWGRGRLLTPDQDHPSPAAKIQNTDEREVDDQMDTSTITNLQDKFSECSAAGTVDEESKGIGVFSMEKEGSGIRTEPVDNIEEELKEKQRQGEALQLNSLFQQARIRTASIVVEHMHTMSLSWCSLSPLLYWARELRHLYFDTVVRRG